MNTVVAVLTLVAYTVSASPANAQVNSLRSFEQLTLTKGVMYEPVRGALEQPVSVKNGSGKFLDFITIECGFYRAGVLVGVGLANLANVGPGETANGEAGLTEVDADSTRCRIAGAIYSRD